MHRGAPVERVRGVRVPHPVGRTCLSTSALIAACRTMYCTRRTGSPPPVRDRNNGWFSSASPRIACNTNHVPVDSNTSQDLKTGFLLGATPRKQQIGELAGVLTSATFVCLAVLLLDKGYGFGTQELPAPQATLMKVVIEGVLQNSLPWTFVGIGVAIALVCELARIPSLPFAVGVYLPLSTFTPLFIGGMLRMFLEKKASTPEEVSDRREKGILFGSGLVGGEGLLGIGIAAVAFLQNKAPQGFGNDWPGASLVALLAFGFLVAGFARSCIARRRS